MEQLLTAREAAEYLRISLATLAEIERQGKIHPYRPGPQNRNRRYTLRMLNNYLESTKKTETPGN